MWRYNNGIWLILGGDPERLQKLEVVLDSGGSPSDSEMPALIDIPLS